MATPTTNYGLLKPAVGSAIDQDLWGNELNADMDDIDGLLRAGITISTQATQTTLFTADVSISVKKLYPCDATTASFIANLPSAASAGNGGTLYLKKIDVTANTITITANGSDTIDGSATQIISVKNNCYGLVSDGVSAWNIIDQPTNISFNNVALTGVSTAPTAAIGTNTTQIATTEFAVHNTVGGVGQVWANVSGSRSLSTVYTNTTGRPIMIIVTASYIASSGTMNLVVGGVTVAGQTGNASTDNKNIVTAVIPAGTTYQVTGTNITYVWVELA